MRKPLSRNALLVKYFAQLYQRGARSSLGIPRKNLMKLIFEADVLAREYLGQPISDFQYVRYKYGPYAFAIEEAVAELEGAGHVEPKREPWYAFRDQGAYRRLIDLRQPVAFDFDPGESAVLDYVTTNYLNMPIREFIDDVIYHTAPMKAAVPMGKPLPMELANHAGTRRVGFRLQEVLEAEEALDRGQFISLSDFVDELRSKAPA
jgi:hypothetical protein